MTVHEPAGIETLDLEPAHIHSWNEKEYVRIGVVPEDASLPNGTISLLLVQFDKDRIQCKACQAMLTAAEIDLVVAGLQEARRRMAALNEEAT